MNTIGKLVPSSPGKEILALDRDYFPRPWTEKQWFELRDDQSLLFSWRDDSDLIGFALFGHLAGDDTVHLFKILLHPRARGKGEAPIFWEALARELKKLSAQAVYLEVEGGNVQAIRFYERMGFKTLRRNRGFYSNGQDALIMLLTL